MSPESQSPSLAVEVWVTSPAFFHTTAVPCPISTRLGANRKSRILTLVQKGPDVSDAGDTAPSEPAMVAATSKIGMRFDNMRAPLVSTVHECYPEQVE